MKTLILCTALFSLPLIAQAQTGDTTTTTTGANTQDTGRRGFDPGWLGLIGLVGLAGLWRKQDDRRSSPSNLGTTARV